MKIKILFTFLFALAVNSSFASQDKLISEGELPSHARFFLRTEFPKSQIITVYQLDESDGFLVKTDDESKFSFDEDGKWMNLECPKVGVPSFVIPQKIQTALRKNCGPNTKVIQLKKLSRGRYDVELSNGFGLRFDRKLEIVDVRDRTLMSQSFK